MAHHTHVLYDGYRAQVIEQRLSSPNGLAIDRKRQRLYMSMVDTLGSECANPPRVYRGIFVTTLFTERVCVYSEPCIGRRGISARVRHPQRQPIAARQDIHLLTMPDNIYVHADTGDLWIGAHPVVYKVIELFQRPRQIHVTESSCARQV